VGAATGFRWAAPLDTGRGTLTRYAFLAMMLPQHILYRIPWGGSLAIRTSALESTGLLDHWAHCLGEDTSAYGRLRDAGLRLAFVPAATQVNSEAIYLDGAHTFILRQILCVRLHHVLWPLIFAVNIATAVSFLVCCLLALVGVAGAVLAILGVANEAWKLTAFAIIPALNCAGQFAALTVGDRLVREAVAAPSSPPSGPKLLAAAAFALGSTTYGLVKAPFTRSFE
jgi:hypothetical protein